MVQRLARGPFKAEIRVRFPLALPSLRNESLLQQSRLHLLLVLRIAGSLGRFGDHWDALVSAALVLGSDLFARHGGWLLCQRIQESYLSLRTYRATVSDRRHSLALFRLDTHQGKPYLGRCSRWNWSRIPAGVALFEKAGILRMKLSSTVTLTSSFC